MTYCGHEMNEFVPQRTCAYISQHDLHYGEMTVRETLDFSGRCLGVGTQYELLAELTRKEAEAGIKPDPEIDAFMKAAAMSGQQTSLVTDYVLKVVAVYRLFAKFHEREIEIVMLINCYLVVLTDSWIGYLRGYRSW